MRSAVWLRLYDISNGKAAAWSPLVLGKRIEAVWHTGVHVYGREYFYGRGIESLPPQEVEAIYDMQIVEEQLLGYTERTQQEFEAYLCQLDLAFTPVTYDLIRWNCNHFSDACIRFLLDGVGISEGILELPDTVRSTFFGAIVLRCYELLSRNRNAAVADGEAPRPSFLIDSRQQRLPLPTGRQNQRRSSQNSRRGSSNERVNFVRRHSMPRMLAPPPTAGGRGVSSSSSCMASSASAPAPPT